ncbi:hypothetical protein [Lactococcus ileimucosae]|uniref:hypothetical protein n=1 Tax=Lactococcus ileimucosae TaxID=2941329 RepID=UPI0035161024
MENYKKSENPYKLHDALKKIETKHNIKIIKFTSFKNDKTIQYNFNSISPISWNKKSFFNKNIKVTNMTQKIEDKDIIGIYYFTDYNSSIDKELSYLGLATVNYEIRPTS